MVLTAFCRTLNGNLIFSGLLWTWMVFAFFRICVLARRERDVFVRRVCLVLVAPLDSRVTGLAEVLLGVSFLISDFLSGVVLVVGGGDFFFVGVMTSHCGPLEICRVFSLVALLRPSWTFLSRSTFCRTERRTAFRPQRCTM